MNSYRNSGITEYNDNSEINSVYPSLDINKI